MIKLPVYNEKGDQVEEIEINTEGLGETPNIALMKQAVVMYQGNKRQGTHKTKGRSEIAGAKHKLWKQKGTGRARVGAGKVSLFVGGGHCFALQPRDYRSKMPAKARKLALNSAILSKIIDKEITVIDDINFEKAQTKRASSLLKSLKLEGRCLVSLSEVSKSTLLSFRNLKQANISKVADLNTLDVLNCKHFVVSKSSIQQMTKVGE